LPGKLVLVRPGQSEWNLENLFTGWTDVDLSAHGRVEALEAGNELLREKLTFDLAFTSGLEARHPDALGHPRRNGPDATQISS
jgi:2,3-bisphosphoglycerate-dependent phosphoglycerate mutase